LCKRDSYRLILFGLSPLGEEKKEE